MQIKFFIIEQSCLTVKDGAEWLNSGLINSYGKTSPGNNWEKKSSFQPQGKIRRTIILLTILLVFKKSLN